MALFLVAVAALNLTADRRLGSLETHRVAVGADPAYARDMRYEGWSLADVLSLLPGVEKLATDPQTAITFVASDGYRASQPLRPVWEARRRGTIAFRDLDAGARKWKRFRAGKSEVTPAPFYLVWSGGKDPSLPWPYGLIRIELSPLEDVFGRAAPKDPAALPGFEVFRANCLSCHSVNLSGGSVGPELNVPRNVTEYWIAAELQPYVRNAGAFHFRARMPAFESLSERQISDVVLYLRTMKDEKVCTSTAACEELARAGKD
jgi:mono/diheme cytochrome c family protein